MELWVARNFDNSLWLSGKEPFHYGRWWTSKDDFMVELYCEDFPEVTFENSPQKVKVELIK